ncbi:NusG domain II-containing protein [Alkalilimnicola sp. S0819]|uniref:NusG domain II-containing protein n=1 Tax=Alkalilimnicola sp. S0819 TaxID=2613922 RepID=UPI001869B18D|nr:NusG domain II-containing protein [Alkalilimnicola sp. S0819]
MSWTDRLLCLLALLAVIASYALLWGEPGRATHASVWVAGEQRHRLALDQPGQWRVQGPLGESRIEVRDGRVRVTASPGPRQICVRTGWLEQAGESAICLPNQVVVRVEGDGGYDAMNF